MAGHPYPHTWVENGYERQVQIHLASNGHEAVWDALSPGDKTPWQSLNQTGVRFTDEQIVSR